MNIPRRINGKINNEYLKRYNRTYFPKKRMEAIKILGSKCVHCGIEDHRVLQIDHIIPLEQHKIIGKRLSPYRTYLGVCKGEVDNLQLLCANCHVIKTYYQKIDDSL